MRNRRLTVRERVLVIFAVVFALTPIGWALTTSLKRESDIFKFPPTINPLDWGFHNYVDVIQGTSIIRYITNTTFVAIVSVLLILVVAIHAAYAVSRYAFREKKPLMITLLLTSMLPGIAVLLPLYLLAVKVGAYNRFWGMILVYAAWRTPIVVWLLTGFINRIPSDIEEAALIDGCSRLRTLYQIVLPLAQPGLASAALISFVFIWNDFLVGFSFSTQDATRVLQVGLYQFVTEYGVNWGQLTSGVMLALIPIVVLFVLLEPRFIAGLSSGASKG